MIDYFKRIDIKTYEHINKNLQNSLLNKTMIIITKMGDFGMVWIIISLFLLAIKQYRVEGLMVISSLAVTTILGEGIIKHTIKRQRPFSNGKENKLLISKPITYSFPSGHTASSFATASILVATNNKLSIYVMILAILIAFSRIYLNVHYLSDVLSGVILGIICSTIVFNIFNLIT